MESTDGSGKAVGGPSAAVESGAAGAVLVACAHGTRDVAGRAAVGRLVAAVRAAAPAPVEAAFVDVQEPTPEAVLARVEGPAVVVPLLLSTGYHVEVDLARAAAGAPHGAVVAGPLGPDERLVGPLLARLPEHGPHDEVVLVAAGSSRPGGARDVEEMAQLLAARLGRAVRAVYLSAAQPRLDAVVADAAAEGRRVVAASYLLAPGHFQRKAEATGAVVGPPLLHPDADPDAELVDLVLARYREA